MRMSLSSGSSLRLSRSHQVFLPNQARLSGIVPELFSLSWTGRICDRSRRFCQVTGEGSGKLLWDGNVSSKKNYWLCRNRIRGLPVSSAKLL